MTFFHQKQTTFFFHFPPKCNQHLSVPDQVVTLKRILHVHTYAGLHLSVLVEYNHISWWSFSQNWSIVYNKIEYFSTLKKLILYKEMKIVHFMCKKSNILALHGVLKTECFSVPICTIHKMVQTQFWSFVWHCFK